MVLCGKFGGWIGTGLAYFFEYETFKVVHIRSVKLGAINRLLQTLILGFVIGYIIIYQKGYQKNDAPISSVTTKVKGIGFTNTSFGPRIFDVPDYVVPAQMKDSFFVMTSAIITPKQNQTVCPEDPEVAGVICTDDPTVCQQGLHDMLGNGVQTGNCVPSDRIMNTSVCEIFAWCPVEDNKPLNKVLIPEAENFTVLIKNSVTFPSFNVRRRNILPAQNNSFLKNCEYQANDPLLKLCPIFRLGTIAKHAGIDFQEASNDGAVISITIVWNCDFDYSVEDCLPSYQFSRLDEPNAKIAPGFNFRYANYWLNEGGNQLRTLFKVYGILFVVQVQGKGGRFDPIPLATNLGSGLALLAIVSIICDILLLYCVKMKEFYRKKKYLIVTGDDAFNTSIFEDSNAIRVEHATLPRHSDSLHDSDCDDVSRTGDDITILPTVKRNKIHSRNERSEEASTSATSSSNP